jgi:hypothetical protein
MSSNAYYWIDNSTIRLGEVGNTVYELNPTNDALRIFNANADADAVLVVDGSVVASNIQTSSLLPSRVIGTDEQSRLVHTSITTQQIDGFGESILQLQQDVINKQDTIIGAATSITNSNLDPELVVVSDENGKVAISNVSRTELESHPQRLSYLENAEIVLTELDQDVVPMSTDTQTIGTDARRWKSIYATGVETSNANVEYLRLPNIEAEGGTVHIEGNVFITGNIQTPDGVVDFENIETHVVPSASKTFDVGSAEKPWRHVYAGNAYTDFIQPVDNANVTVDGNLVVTGSLIGRNGTGIVPDPDWENIETFVAPSTDMAYTLGRSGRRWSNVWTTGVVGGGDDVTVYGNLVLTENLLGPDGNVFKDIDLTYVSTDIIPSSNVYSVGTSERKWSNVWAENVNGNVDAANLYGDFEGTVEFEGVFPWVSTSLYMEKGSLLYPAYAFDDKIEAGMYLESNGAYLGLSIDNKSGMKIGNANIQVDQDTFVAGNIEPKGQEKRSLGSESNVWDTVHANVLYTNDANIQGTMHGNIVPRDANISIGLVDKPWDQAFLTNLNVNTIVVSGDIIDSNGNFPLDLDLSSIKTDVAGANADFTLGTIEKPWSHAYITDATIDSNVYVTDTITASVVSSNVFTGDGSELTSLNASNITTGTVSNDRLTHASTLTPGIVQLNNSTSSTSTTQAATSNSVKNANDNANTRALQATTVSAGDGLIGGGSLVTNRVISHADTSAMANVSVTDGNAITSIGVDDFGHIQTVGATDFDTRFVKVSGGDVSGPLTATAFIGDGSGLTSLNASNMTTGTVPTSRLSLASTTTIGIVQLNDTISSTSSTQAATANSVKVVNDDVQTRALQSISITGESGLTGGGTLAGDRTLRHADTSSMANVSVSGGGAVTSINVDDFGHVQSVGTTNLDSRFVIVSGDTMSGTLTAPAFIGDGSGLTSLNGTNIASGTIPNARLISASTATAGIVQLNNTTTSTSTTHAATANSVKSANDNANTRALQTTTVSAGSGLTGGGSLSSNRTISHADTSAMANVSVTNGNVITSIGVDDFGHIQSVGTTDLDSRFVNTTGDTMSGSLTATAFIGNGSGLTSLNGSTIASGTVPNARLTPASTTTAGIVQLNNTTSSTSTTQAATANSVKSANDNANTRALQTTTVSAGSGLTGGGSLSSNRTISHADTSAMANVSASGGTVVTSIGVDGFGHLQSVGTTDLDSRFVNVSGDIMSGTLTTQDILISGNARIQGNLTIDSGNLEYVNTSALTSDQISINNLGTGPALEVNQDGGQDIIVIKDDGNVVATWFDGGHVAFAYGPSGTLNNATSSPSSALVFADGDIESSGVFIGNGSGLTSLNGSNIASGTVPNARLTSASTTTAGIVQLNNTTSSTSTTQAATANSVKSANDNANTRALQTTTVSAGSGLTGGGSLSTNRTISHADTSAMANVSVTGGSAVTSIGVDDFGHIQSVGTTDLDSRFVNVSGDTMSGSLTATAFVGNGSGLTSLNGSNIASGTVPNARLTSASTTTAGIVQLNDTTTSTSTTQAATANSVKSANDNANTRALQTTSVSAGSGLTGGGSLSTNRIISHADTSTQASVNNSGGTVIQDVTLDGFGHVTGLASLNLDSRYYTESESDARFVNVTGDTMSGSLTASSFVGDGSGLTSLNGTNISSGTVPNARLTSASTTTPGIVQLSTSTNSTSTTIAATSSAVKAAYDLAAASVSKSGDTMTGGLQTPIVYLTSGTNIYQTGGDAAQLTETYIVFAPGSSGTDWLNLRQIGGDNAYKLAWDFHDDNECRVVWRRIYSTLDPDGVYTCMSLDGDNLTVTGTVSASLFSGSGASLTSLNASNITSGTVNVARLPDASTSAQGVVQLSTSTNSTSTSVAATASSVKSANDNANTRALQTTTISAGSGLTGGGSLTANRIISHADTSSQESVINSGGTFIQDLYLDGFGHVTGITSVNLDSRYYTESECDARFVNVTGDTMSGSLTASAFVGDGSGLTSLNGSNISSGTVANSRLTSASTTTAGIVQLSSATTSTSTTLAATASAVKSANDNANTRALQTTNISAGTGLSGGGNLSASRTLSVDSTVFRSGTSVSGNVRFSSGSGLGIRFWDNDGYKIWMSSTVDSVWGGRLDSTSDYNMYFRMSGGTNRGFVFKNGDTNVAQIDASGNLYLSGTMNSGTVPWERISGVPSASTSVSGSVQLSTSTNSTSTTTAATSSAVKSVNDNANTRALQTTTISAGSGLTGGGSLASNRTLSHADTSSQASVNNSSGTVIQDITLDGFGHITGIGSYNLDNRYYTETESNDLFVNRSGDTMTGGLTLSGDIVATGSNHIFGSGGRFGVTVNDGQGNLNLTFNHDNGGIPEQNGSSCRIETSVDSTAASFIFELADNVTGGTVVNTSEVMRLTTSGANITGTLGVSGALTAASFSGNGGSLTSLNASNLSSGTVATARLPTASTSASGIVQLSSATNSTSTTVAATASSVKSANDNANTRALQTTTISAGSGLTGGGSLASNRTISHADTSTQASVNNSGGTVIQDITLDGFGHVTGLASYNLDGRYYTETEADSRFVNVTGDTISGTLSFGSTTRQMINLWSSSYGIGVQDSTTYFRSGGRFSWHRGGVHSDTENAAGSGGTVAMTLDSSSNLSVTGDVNCSNVYTSGAYVRTTNATLRLGSDMNNAASWFTVTSGAGTDGNSIVDLKMYSAGSTFGTRAGKYLSLFAGGSSRIYINSGGDVGIGTEIPSQKLDVRGNAYIDGVVTADGVNFQAGVDNHIQVDGAIYRAFGQCFITVDDQFYIRDNSQPADAANWRFYFNTDSGTLQCVGDVTAYASDKRLKQDIMPIQTPLDTIKKLNGYTYRWRDDIDDLTMRGKDIGLLAQDLEDAGLHECVTLAPFDNDNGTSKSGHEYKTIHYNKLHALWSAALKEQQDIIERQQRLIDEQKSTLEHQRLRLDAIETYLNMQ